jgi:hypothetical protein
MKFFNFDFLFFGIFFMKKMKVFEHDKHEEREEKNEVKKK